jgi:hypothetical protein
MARSSQRAGIAACLLVLPLAACGTTVSTSGAGATDASGAGGSGRGATQDAAGGTGGTTGSAILADGTTGGGASVGSASTGGGTGTDGSTGGGTTVDGTTGSTTVVPVNGDHQGITPTTIKVGFIGIDAASQAQTNALFGASSPPADTKAAMNAIVAYINAHGGIDGRKIIPSYVERQTSSTDPNSDAALCTALTEDAKVFAVVTNYSGGEEACYAKHHTLLLNDTLASQHEELTKYSPYLWSPGLTSDEAGYAALVDSLGAQGWFAPADVKVGIVGYDDPSTHFTFDRVIKPRLNAIGFPLSKVQAEFITQPESDADNAKWAQDIQGTVLHFRSAGINRVFFMAPGAGVPILFMNQAESQQYHPIYGLSSYDSPGFLLQGKMANSQLHGSMGAGFNEITDVDAQRGDPFPTGIAEQRCLSILQANGQRPSNRGAAFGAMYLCDGAFMLQEAAKGIGAALSVQSWAAQAERMGSRFQATYSLPGGTMFEPGMHFGSASYRWLKFVDSCSCFTYASKNKPIPRQPL